MLAEVIKEHLRPITDHGQRRIITHRRNRLLSGCRHRHNCLVDILLSEAEVHEFLFEIADAILHVTTALEFLQLHAVLTQPLAVRMCLRQLLLDFAIVVNFALLRINQQNLSRLQTTLANDVARFEVHHANL